MNTRTNKRRGLIVTMTASLAIIGMTSVVYAQATSNCLTTYTPSCGYVLPGGTFYYTAVSFVHEGSGITIPAGVFFNPVNGDFFRVGDPNPGGSTTTPPVLPPGSATGAGSATGIGNPNNPNNGNQNNNNQNNTNLVTNNTNIYYPPSTTTIIYYQPVSTTTATSTNIGAPDTGGNGKGGGGAPGAPNTGFGGQLGLTLFNLLSSGILAAGAATYIIRNSVTYR